MQYNILKKHWEITEILTEIVGKLNQRGVEPKSNIICLNFVNLASGYILSKSRSLLQT